jgi:hypothetical protein
MVRPLISPKVYTIETDRTVVKSPNKHISTPLGGPRNRTVVIPAPEPLGFYLLQENGSYLLQEDNGRNNNKY